MYSGFFPAGSNTRPEIVVVSLPPHTTSAHCRPVQLERSVTVTSFHSSVTPPASALTRPGEFVTSGTGCSCKQYGSQAFVHSPLSA